MSIALTRCGYQIYHCYCHIHPLITLSLTVHVDCANKVCSEYNMTYFSIKSIIVIIVYILSSLPLIHPLPSSHSPHPLITPPPNKPSHYPHPPSHPPSHSLSPLTHPPALSSHQLRFPDNYMAGTSLEGKRIDPYVKLILDGLGGHSIRSPSYPYTKHSLSYPFADPILPLLYP